MGAQQFAYWLQGFAELNEAPPTPEQWQSIREHLATVFVKVTPPVGTPTQIWPGTAWPPTTAAKPFIHELMRSECKGGTVLASGDGDTRLC